MSDYKTSSSSFKPSVVLLLGDFSSDQFLRLKQSVDHRLAEDFGRSSHLLTWGLYNKELIDAGELTRLFTPFLNLEYWQQLRKDSKIPPEQPLEEKPLPEVQLIVLATSQAIEAGGVSDLLTPLLANLKKRIKPRAEIRPVLVVIGDKVSSREDLSYFWPKFWLNYTALGGLKVTFPHILEVCQTLIVSLASSDLVSTLDKGINKSQKSRLWVVLGSSAVLVDMLAMKDYLTNQILVDFIEPLVSTSMIQDEKNLINEMVMSLADGYYGRMLGQSATIMGDWKTFPFGTWKIESKGKRHLDIVQLQTKSKLDRAIKTFRIQPSAGTTKEIANYYKDVDVCLTNQLSKLANDYLSSILKIMSYVLDRSIDVSTINPGLASVDKNLIKLISDWPRGLRSVEYTLARLVIALKRPDFTYQNEITFRYYAHGDPYYRTLAEKTEVNSSNGYRRIFRQKRRVNNLVGLLACLIPIWPLLYGLLVRFTTLTSSQSAWLSLAPVIILPVLVTIGHTHKINELIREHQKIIHGWVAHSVMRIMAKVLREYRKQIISSLYGRSIALTKLVQEIDNSFQNFESQVQRIHLSKTTDTPDTFTLFELVDFKLCDEWAKRTADRINAEQQGFGSLTGRVITENVFPIMQEEGQTVSLVDIFRTKIEGVASTVFEPGMLMVDTLSEQQPKLAEGRLWSWLYEKAHPLGNPLDEIVLNTFTIISVGKEAILLGGFGQGTKYWPENAKISKSRLENEILCLRGHVIEIDPRKP